MITYKIKIIQIIRKQFIQEEEEMLSQILARRSLMCYYRLVKPTISEFKSIQELQYDRKQRELAMIEQYNASTLNENKAFSKEKFVSSLLATSEEISQDILKRQLNFSAISPETLKHHTLEQGLGDSKIQYPFSLQEVESGLPQLDSIPMHYSYQRGVPIINEYELDKKTAYVFNLPEDFSSREISEKLGVETIKQIKVQYCRLGLPACAKVYFNTDEAVNNLVLNNKTYIELGGRVCFIKTHFDKEKLQLKNRRLVIHDIQQDQENLILELSRYGRIIHFDYPTYISRNPSLEQVRQKYKNSDQLIKINHHRKDGSIDYEYYPSLEESFRMNTLGSAIDFQAHLVQKKQRLEAMYKNRMRYAQQVDVYEGKQNQISIKNMGFCIATFSCTEEAQNCYFNLRFNKKMQLFDSKTMQEFQIDQQYRKKILRFIDNEYNKARIRKQNSKTIYDKQMEEYIDELSMFEKLVELETRAGVLKEKVNQLNDEQPEVLISYFNTRVREIKKNLQKKLGSKSFDQLAEKQLFGRVLPKHDPLKPKLQIEVMQQTSEQMKDLFKDVLPRLSSAAVKQRDNSYRRQKAREIKRMGMNEMTEEELEAAEGQEGEQGEASDMQQDGDEYEGKRNFSTAKKRATPAFRNRTSLQLANYILRYCEYVRSIINEYQGIFAESRFNYSVGSSFLNPDNLQFGDSTSFITEEDLPKFLQCMRTFTEAKTVYTDFWKDYEYFKSRSINLNEYIFNVKNKPYQALSKYYDNGCVKEVYEVEDGQDIDKKVLSLNATVAGFGQEFKTHTDQNGQKVIIRVAKLQNICPLDRIAKMSQAKRKYLATQKPTSKQHQVFNKYKYQMIETGEIPPEVRQEFNIDQNKTLDDLFEQLAAEAGIYKKDIEMVLNLKNFTPDQIAEDVGLQLELEKARVALRQSRASDYAKDPSNIQVKDKEGYFKVSKFRQI